MSKYTQVSMKYLNTVLRITLFKRRSTMLHPILLRSITIHQTFRSIMGTSLEPGILGTKIFEPRIVVHVEDSSNSQLPRAQHPAISVVVTLADSFAPARTFRVIKSRKKLSKKNTKTFLSKKKVLNNDH